MAKKNQRKQFSPHIYTEWGELFEYLTVEQKAEILMAITKFPNYEPKDVQIWGFIKSQLQKDYELFVEKCEKNGQISRNYWGNKNKSNDIQNNTEDTERIPNDSERHPKLITNNELHKQKQITKTKTETKTKKIDPYFLPIKDKFLKEYKKIFNKKGYLGNSHILKLAQLSDEIEDLENKIPEILHKLKQIDWDIDFTPDINWLLKNDNLISILNGEYGKKNNNKKGDDKNKLLELIRSE